jgi:alpha-N-arabinofuranosidase
VKYWGVGNENWGCGGNMTADFYADQYRRYATFCRNYGENRLFKIAGGANSEDFGWTETLMQKIPHHMMDGLSLHYYTSNWRDKGSATGFGEDRYFDILRRCLHIEEAIDTHMEIMDRYDPEKNVALVFDEWGTWYNVEPGTNPGFLFQQNSMRDALVAGLTLNYLNARCERVRMANIAQTINVLQALIFTEDEKMVLTPTYHIYDMYQVHHDATLLPQTLESPDYKMDSEALKAVSASASLDQEGRIHISLVNIDPRQAIEMEIELKGRDSGKVSGRILQSEKMDSHNTFDNPEEVVPVDMDDMELKNGKLELSLPARSVIVLTL